MIQTPINPGILETVRWLNDNGFQTTDSGDGETHVHECDQSCPYVHILCDPGRLVSETDRLTALLRSRGVDIKPCNEDGSSQHVQALYCPADCVATISLWNVKL